MEIFVVEQVSWSVFCQPPKSKQVVLVGKKAAEKKKNFKLAYYMMSIVPARKASALTLRDPAYNGKLLRGLYQSFQRLFLTKCYLNYSK